MALPNPNRQLMTAFDEWMNTQISHLSLSATQLSNLTCTACNEILGMYIIDYQGDRFHYSAFRTYAFLKFILEEQSEQY